MENNLVRYTYIRHPLNPEWCITIARSWDNAEKTALRVTWCANKMEDYGGRHLVMAEDFDRKKAHKICTGRLQGSNSHVVMTLDKPYVRGDGRELVPQIIKFVMAHPRLPAALRRLLKAAEAAEYTLLPRNLELSEAERVRTLYLAHKSRTSHLRDLPPNCS